MNRSAVNFHLDEIDAWRSGAKATVGQPATGERYALAMRQNIQRHAAALRALGVAIDDTGNFKAHQPPHR